MAADSKTEKATPKKRKDERKKGSVFQSKDIVTLFSILGTFFILKFTFPFISDYMKSFLNKYIIYMKVMKTITITDISEIARDSVIAVIAVAGPIMIIAMVIGIIGAGAQTKFLFSYETVKFKFSRMSILKGIKQLFSLRSVVELIKSMIKVIAIGYTIYNTFMSACNELPKLMSVSIEQGTLFIFDHVMSLIIDICLVFAAISVFDYFYQWFDYEKSLKMSKQEIKDEYKHSEGDPQIKGKIKDKQRQMAMQRMMQQVPEADVVIRNPTHFAIALKYDIDANRAPIVVAKGADYLALRIIAVAEENQIPITENRPLARMLYKTVEIGQEIPPDYYAALAEIMAWVYTLKKQD